MGKTYKDQLDPWSKRSRIRKPRKKSTVKNPANNSKKRRWGNDEERNFEKFNPKR